MAEPKEIYEHLSETEKQKAEILNSGNLKNTIKRVIYENELGVDTVIILGSFSLVIEARRILGYKDDIDEFNPMVVTEDELNEIKLLWKRLKNN